MPGFKRNRFVGVNEEDLDDFTCGLCHTIFTNPVITKCCQLSYCSDCITEWLSEHKTCPKCQNALLKTDLNAVQKVIIKLLNRLQIKCDFSTNGCKRVIKLNDLNKHLMDCEFRTIIEENKCKTCDLNIGNEDKHNCIEDLRVVNKNICEQMKRIIEENTKLRKENKKLVHTFKQSENSMKPVIECARNQIDSYVIEKHSNSLSSHLKQFYVNHCKEAVIQNNTFYKISQHLYKEICGNRNQWDVWVFTREDGEPMPNSDDYFRIRFDKLIIKIFLKRKLNN